MREILFRGKRIDNGEWVYGSMLIDNVYVEDIPSRWKYYIWQFNSTGLGFHESIEVIPSSIGRYTGLKDKNGVEIYEGDIMCYTKAGGHNSNGIVKYVNEFARWEYWHTTLKQGFPILSDCANMEVIVNIFEHPHLLEG